MIAVIIALSSWRNTDFSSPPRFDGAGYAILAESLMTGRGYREIDHPDAPRHGHFPPGYPLALGLFWSVTGGRSATTAHLFSIVCTVTATIVMWHWFRAMYSPRVAGILAISLALNWTWGRTSGAIQSEPFFFLLEGLALLTTVWVCRRGGIASGIGLGMLLGATALTRQVGVAVIAAVVIALLMKGRWVSAFSAVLASALVILPWIIWISSVRENTQVELVGKGSGGVAELIASQAIFYTQRLPDQLFGPIVEIGTVFSQSWILRRLVNIWALMVSAILLLGWLRTLGMARRRLAGTTALITLALLLIWPFTEAGRFLIPLVPCMLVGAVEGLVAILTWLSPRLRMPRTIAATMVLAISLPYSTYSLASNRAEVQRLTHSHFDAACAWIAMRHDAPGPVMTRHPGEAYWQTNRRALAPTSNDPSEITREITRRQVAFLLVDDERYVNAPENPLSRYVQERKRDVREVWSREIGVSTVRIFEVVPSVTP